MRKLLCLAIAPLVLGGCQSEVDKCVAQWEKANPSEEPKYCSNFSSGKCLSEGNMTRDEALSQVRIVCMEASNGN
jgi:hypothetical protein